MKKSDVAIEGRAATSSARVKDLLRQDILRGVLKPNQRVTLADVAARYGVGQMPVRQALLQLEGEGLLEISAHKGATIRQADAKFVHDMYEIRRVLEAMLIGNAVKVIRADELEAVRRARDRFEAVAATGDEAGLLKANTDFHNIINVVGNNPEATRYINRGWDLIHAMRLQFGFGRTRVAAMVAEHRNIVAALEARDHDRATAVAEDHCRAARDDLLARLASAG